MAIKEIKDMGASVLTRLKKQTKEAGINYQTGPLYEAILKEDEFFGTWSAKENVWKMKIK